MVPRVRMDGLWLIDPKELEAKQDEATLLAIRDQERVGLDIITDGEQRRESYSNRFATALEGVDTENPGSTLNRSGKPISVPRVTGKIRRKHPVELRDLQFLRANTKRSVKITVPGPFTMSKQAQNEFYQSDEAMALDYAAAVNDEIKDLFASGREISCRSMSRGCSNIRTRHARTVSRRLTAHSMASAGLSPFILCFGYAAVVHDKPTGYSFLSELEGSKAAQISIEAAQPKLDLGVLEKLPSKTIILGVIDLSDMNVETPETVAGRIRKALPHAPAERIVIAPDCGMKYLPRDVAFGKMQAMVRGAAIVRLEQSERLDRQRLELGPNTRKMGLITRTAVPTAEEPENHL